MKFIHHVPVKALFGSSNELDFKLLLKGFFAMLFLGIGIETVLQFIPAVSKYIEYESNKVLFLSDWIRWLLPVIFFIFIQATAEELVFRGYLLQKISRKYI